MVVELEAAKRRGIRKGSFSAADVAGMDAARTVRRETHCGSPVGRARGPPILLRRTAVRHLRTSGKEDTPHVQRSNALSAGRAQDGGHRWCCSKRAARGVQGVHGCFVDHQDNVWIAGNGDAIVQKYSHNLGTLLLQIGEKGRFDSSDGTITGTPTNSSRTLLNRPADIAVDPDNGDLYIADGYGNRRIVVFDKTGRYLRQWGEQATLAEAEAGVGVGGKFLAVVHGVNLGNDGLVYVNDRKGNRIQVFDKDGSFVRNIWVNRGYGLSDPAVIGTSWDITFSVDRNQRLVLGGGRIAAVGGRAGGGSRSRRPAIPAGDHGMDQGEQLAAGVGRDRPSDRAAGR